MSSEAETPIYLDHAATSWPKPTPVREQMLRFLDGLATNAGRSGHEASVRSARMVFEVREQMARLLGVPDSRDLVFTRGTTEGLNLVLKGFLNPGDRVLVSPMEHNSMMRPLRVLESERKIHVDLLPADELGKVRPDRNEPAGDPPRLIALAHASNVNGVVQDIAALRRAYPDAAILVDAAQTAGVLPIHIQELGIDFLACSAHKGLLGPTGVGLCYLDPKHEVRPLMEGGTGSRSESEVHPMNRPDRYEGGTMNLHGIAGLAGALEYIEQAGLLGDHKQALCHRLISGLADMQRVRLHSPQDGSALNVSFTADGLSPSEVAHRLEEEQGILSRPGLQCSPAAHRHLGTFPDGTLRLSPGFGNTEAQIDRILEAIAALLA